MGIFSGRVKFCAPDSEALVVVPPRRREEHVGKVSGKPCDRVIPKINIFEGVKVNCLVLKTKTEGYLYCFVVDVGEYLPSSIYAKRWMKVYLILILVAL